MEEVIPQIAHSFKGESRRKARKILEPSTMERGNVEDALATREREILKYAQDTNSRLSNDVKTAVLMNKTRGQHQEHLRLNAASLSKYHEVKDVLTNYINTEQAFSKDPSNKAQMQ